VLRNHVLASPDADDAAILDRDRFGCWLLVVNCDDVTVHIDGISVAGHTDLPWSAVILGRRSRPTLQFVCSPYAALDAEALYLREACLRRTTVPQLPELFDPPRHSAGT
jgi:hypothetical protein